MIWDDPWVDQPQSQTEQEITETEGIRSVDTFEELGLHEDLLRGIYGYGFERPSIIQQRGILPVIRSSDTVAQAQSGTGKTATFSIGLLQRIDSQSPHLQALVMAPTRELAQQIQRVIMCLGQYQKIVCYTCVGGTNVAEDKKRLKEGGIQVVVGTPGRVVDMIQKKFINPDHLRILVLDEADEMLTRGFIDDVKVVLQSVPADIQIALFSATMPPEILEMTNAFLRNPTKILVKNEQLTLDGIKQYFVSLDKEEFKFETLVELYKNLEIGQCMIFANKKERVDELATRLRDKNFVVSCIHGDMDMSEREQTMREFRTGSSRVLISTDLLGRGIDIQQVNLIINFDLPSRKESYIHRIGRSGRFGRKGTAINFVTPADASFLIELRKYYNTQIDELPTDLDLIYKTEEKK